MSDYFALFDLPRRYAVDRNTLEDRYLQRAAVVHPDRFSQAASSERRKAMEASAELNAAYRTLRDPVQRAEYLVRLGGIDLDSSHPTTGAPKMPEAFLIDMIDRRDAIEEARANGTRALSSYRNRVEEEAEDTLDLALEALERDDVREAARLLVVRRYLQRLLDELTAEIEPAGH